MRDHVSLVSPVKFFSLLLTSVFTLTACGGGGGGGGGGGTPPPPVNQAPNVVIGSNQTVIETTSVTLSATGSSDADGTIRTIAWTQTSGPSVTLSGSNTLTPSFIAPVITAQVTLSFQVTLTDDDGASSSRSVSVIVQPNAAPIANAGSDQTVVETDPVTLSGVSSSDADSIIVQYQWTQTSGPTISLSNANTATASFTAPTTDNPITFSFELTVTDDFAKTGSDSVEIVVNPNAPPIADAGSNQTVVETRQVNLSAVGSNDSDSLIVLYEWTQVTGPIVTLNNANTIHPSFIAPSTASQITLSFSVTVTDNHGETDFDSVDITVNPNTPPMANAGLDQTVVEAHNVVLSGASSSDVDGTIAEYLWEQIGGPSGLPINGASTMSPSFSAPIISSQVTFTFRLTVTDDLGGINADTVNVVVNPNTPPIAVAGDDQVVIENQIVNLSATGSNDTDGSITSYQWVQVSGPSISISNADTESASFTALPVTVQQTLTFALTVTDDNMDSRSDTVTVVIEPIVPPQLEVHFPCEGCRINSSTITVTGNVVAHTYPAPIPQPSNITVTVSAGLNAVQASIDNNGSWIAYDVPVDNSAPDVIVNINAEDSYGDISNSNINLLNRPTLTSGFVVPDPLEANAHYFYENAYFCNRLFRIDPSSNIETVIPCSGTTSTLNQIVDVEIDFIGNRLLLLQYVPGAIYSIDLVNNSLTQIDTSGDAIIQPKHFRLDNTKDRVVIWNNGALIDRSIAEVDLTTGERVILAANTANRFDSYSSSVALDGSANSAYLFTGTDVLEVDLVNDTVSLLADPGPDARLLNPSYTRFDPNMGKIIEMHTFTDNFATVDLSDGATNLLSVSGTDGITMGTPYYFVLDNDANILVSDFSESTSGGDLDAAVLVDSGDGSRSIVFGDTLGSGPQMDDAQSLYFEATTNSIYTLDASTNSLIHIDLSTNTRTIVSGSGVGGGIVDFISPTDLAIDISANKAYVLDQNGGWSAPLGPMRIIEVDLSNGNRSTLSESGDGNGTDFTSLLGVALDPVGDRLFVTDPIAEVVFEVSVIDGARSVLSDNSDNGEALDFPSGVDFDVDSGILLINEEGSGGSSARKLFSVDTSSGDRTTISSVAVGGGVGNGYLGGDVQILSGATRALVSIGNSIVAVDLATGDRQIIFDPTTGNGEIIANMVNIGVDKEKGIAYGIARNYEALFAVEIGSGDRVVVSK